MRITSIFFLQLCATLCFGLKGGLRQRNHQHHWSSNNNNNNKNRLNILSNEMTMTEPCLLVTREDRPSPITGQQVVVKCQLQGKDMLKYGPLMLNVPNLDFHWAKSHNITSGVSTLWTNTTNNTTTSIAVVNQTLQVQDLETSIQIMEPSPQQQQGRRLITSTGTKNALVVRVVSSDSSTSASESELSHYIFGGGGDQVNLKSQFRDCSKGQLNIEPATATGTNSNRINNGVITITMDQSTNGRSEMDVESLVVAQLEQELGDFSTENDLVMLCLPKGTNGGGWVGYGYVNHYLTVYLDEWCNRPSSGMHEIGHNLGLGHSGETNTYDDNTGLMGWAYYDLEGPKMCFNAAKTWQLGWFSNGHVTVSNDRSVWLTGLASCSNNDGDTCILRISRETEDYYAIYNLASDSNAGTKEGENQVVVSKRQSGLDYADSTLVAKLGGDNGSTTYNGPGGFRIRVENISGNRAQVQVSF